MIRKTAVALVLALATSAYACEWAGIAEVRGSRSPKQAVAMCKLIPACLQKYEANEQCKKDWYEQRRIGYNKPKEKREPLPEAKIMKEKLGQVRMIKH